MTCANGRVLRDQIPRVRGPNSLLSPPSRKRPWEQSPKILRNKYFSSGFVLFGAFFREAPKTPKKHLAESATIRRRFRGGDFCTKSPVWFLSNFYLAPLAHSHLRTVLKPYFCSVFPFFFGSEIFRSPDAPPHDVCYVFWGVSKFCQKGRKK